MNHSFLTTYVKQHFWKSILKKILDSYQQKLKFVQIGRTLNRQELKKCRLSTFVLYHKTKYSL